MIKMWLKLFALLLTVAAVVTHSTTVFLNDIEGKVVVSSDSSLLLHCCLSADEDKQVRITWYYNPSGPTFNGSQLLCDKKINKTAKNFTHCEDDDQQLYNLPDNKTNNGWYFCNITVDIPRLKTNYSKGKEVIVSNSFVESTTYLSLVTSTQVPPTGRLPWMWMTLAGSSFIVIVLLVVCIAHRKRCHQSTVEEPVYINHPRGKKQPSPRLPLPVNNLKTASSTQSLRTPRSPRRYEDQRRPRH